MQFGGITAVRTALSRPGLVCWSGLVAILDLATVFVFLLSVGGLGLWEGLAVLAVQRILLIFVLAILEPGSYAAYRGRSADEDGRSVRAVLATAWGGVRADGGPSLTSSLVTRAIAVPVTLALAAFIGTLVLGVDTAAVWSAALFDLPLDRGLLAAAGLIVTATTAAWLVNGAVAYHDLLAIDGEADSRWAWRESAAAATARPLRFLGGSLFRGLLLALPWLVGFGTLLGLSTIVSPPDADPGPLIPVAAAVAYVTIGSLARATHVAYHVDGYEERIRPAVVAGDHAIVEHRRRVAMAAVLVLAAVAGVGMVRTADVAPGPGVPDAEIQPANADATVEVAVERTIRRDFAFEFDEAGYNDSADTWQPVFDIHGQVDRDGKEAIVDAALHGQDGAVIQQRTIYAADGVYALTSATGQIRTANPLEIQVRSGDWAAAVGRPFSTGSGGLDVLTAGSDGWERVASDDETVTYARPDVWALNDADNSMYAPEPDEPDIEYLEDTEARMVVDRETATVRRYEAVTHFQESVDKDDVEEIRRRSTLSITDVGGVDVARPDGLSGPGPLERVWDVIYYA